MRLTVKGEGNTVEKQVDFRLETDETDVNIYANDDLIGWFSENIQGKIEFFRSYPKDDEAFAAGEGGALVVV